MASENLGPRLGVVAGAALALATILAVLVLSANTSFAGFPRLCRLLAKHQYLPARFIHRGRRLVFSAGIIVLAVLSGALSWRSAASPIA